MSFTPLIMPTMPASADFSDASTFLAQTSSAINDSATSWLNDLSALNEIDFAQMGDLPVFSSVVWIGTIPGLTDKPARPDVDTDIVSLLEQLNNLVVPDAPDAELGYVDTGYSSSIRDPLIAKILYDLLNGGYGIDTADEQALFNRERDRESQLLLANIDEVRRQHAATSFPIPTGAMFKALERARQEYTAKLSSVNRDIALKRADLYNDTRKFTIEKALASEDQSISLYNAVQNRLFEIARTEVEITIKMFEAGIKFFQMRLESLIKQVDAKLDIAKTILQIYGIDVQAYGTLINALAVGANVDIQNSRNVLDRDKTAHASRVDKVRFQLEQLRTTVEARKQINEFGVEFFRTGFGAAINGIQGLAVNTSS